MMAQAFARKLPCVTDTPLGVEVEPEVNCRKHRSSSVTSAFSWLAPSGAGRSSSSVVMTPLTDETLEIPLQSTACTFSLVTR